jgi:hypothetical protein
MTPPPVLRLAATRDGCLKVKLFYHTWESKHLRSQVLESDFQVDPPYVEDVSVFLPPEEVFVRLSAFEDIFHMLQAADVLAVTDKLKGFEVRDEDTRTLAYYQVTDPGEDSL